MDRDHSTLHAGGGAEIGEGQILYKKLEGEYQEHGMIDFEIPRDEFVFHRDSSKQW